jgi:hypothetical protein
LRLVNSCEEGAADQLGKYTALALTYTDQDGPLIRQTLRTYSDGYYLVVETTTLRDL